MYFIGIDPGQSGAIALLKDDGSVENVMKCSETPRDMSEFLWDFHDDVSVAMIEKVGAYPGMGVAGCFKFGESYGILQGILATLGIRYDIVSPQRWQKAMRCLTKGDKNVSKAAAQRLFPQQKITHAIADALLIAEYCRLEHLKRA